MKLRLDKYLNGTPGRHETFVPRYGWLTKGYVRCAESPHVFNDDDAIEQLGVGKNMVRSIRFWCLLFGLLEEPGKDSDLGKGALSPGALGIRLIGQFLPVENMVDTETGWDPYLEDIASLWLLALANFQAAIQRSVLAAGIQLLFASVLLAPGTWSFHYRHRRG